LRTLDSGVLMGLRERKEEQTRRTVEEAAFRRFDERGFPATTVAAIAAAADLAPRTFLGYFPTKEDVVFFERRAAAAPPA
jgi:AcrR family transcriptional regulator